jgi:hypothetical protein
VTDESRSDVKPQPVILEILAPPPIDAKLSARKPRYRLLAMATSAVLIAGGGGTAYLSFKTISYVVVFALFVLCVCVAALSMFLWEPMNDDEND